VTHGERAHSNRTDGLESLDPGSTTTAGRLDARFPGGVSGATMHGATASASAAAVREAILARGLDADRALALADALEREGRLVEAVDALAEANRLRRDGTVERRLVRLRRAAFAQLEPSLPPLEWPPRVPEPSNGNDGPPEITPAELTPALLRTGILQHGSVLVRGMVPQARVQRLRDAIDRAFEAQDATLAGVATRDTAVWYDPLDGIYNATLARQWGREGGAVLAADSPRGLHEFLETVRELRIDRLLTAYFGERPTLSAEKTTLRRIDAKSWKTRLANWHQDGSFLGAGIRTVDVWFALSRCGRDAPGMDIIPIRVNDILGTGDSGAHYGWSVSLEMIEQALPGVPVWRPEFQPGDVLMFDDRCLHRTAAELGMPKVRYAIESWFFASSAYPANTSTPIVV
jgi:Phytanoyl-CoA dioxygenase (PhyH)